MKLKYYLSFLPKFSYKFLFLVNSKFCIITPYTKYIINSRMKLSEEITRRSLRKLLVSKIISQSV